MVLPSVIPLLFQRQKRFFHLLAVLSPFFLGVMFSQLELVDRTGSSFQSVQNKLPRTPRTQVVAEVANNFSNERASLLLANSHLKGQLSRLPVGGGVDHRKVGSVLKNEPSILNMDPIFSFAVRASAKGHGVRPCAAHLPLHRRRPTQCVRARGVISRTAKN